MKISFILPVFNSEAFLAQCIESVIAQQLEDFECIIINDGSLGDCQQITRKFQQQYPKSIIYLENSQNKGLGQSRNSGVQVATGDYIFFLDSDDYLADGSVVSVMSLLIMQPDILITNHLIFEQHRDLVKLPFPNIVRDFAKSRFGIPTYSWGKFFRRSFWLAHDFHFESIYAEDLQLIPLVIKLAKSIEITNIPVCVYRSNFNSLTHSFYSAGAVFYVLQSLYERFAKFGLIDDEFKVFLLSSFYNLTKVVGLGFQRYYLYKKFIKLIPAIPKSKYFSEPIINKSKKGKLERIYLTRGFSLFKPNGRYWKKKIFRISR